MQPIDKRLRRSKRGDTLIEVMFAIAVFSLVAVLSISMMNLGLANSETSLEFVVARNELNAQAEALRFIHASYFSELSLPTYGELSGAASIETEKYQQYTEVWQKIAESAVNSSEYNIEYPLNSCSSVYNKREGSDHNLLYDNKAFVINTRDLTLGEPARTGDASGVFISARTNPSKFQEATLNARIIYSKDAEGSDKQDVNEGNMIGENNPNNGHLYNHVALVEGIWVVAVKSEKTKTLRINGLDTTIPLYYDFYIETCWNPPNSTRPTSLDTVIRLYNPEYHNQ